MLIVEEVVSGLDVGCDHALLHVHLGRGLSLSEDSPVIERFPVDGDKSLLLLLIVQLHCPECWTQKSFCWRENQFEVFPQGLELHLLDLVVFVGAESGPSLDNTVTKLRAV